MQNARLPYLAGIVAMVLLPMAASASFAGPSQSPPNGNVAGVVWNRSTSGGSANQQTADFNISGNGRVAGDMILGDTKSLRIDKNGAATFGIGNWGSGSQPLTVTVYGDFQALPVGAGGVPGKEGKITAPKFCIGASCITAWPAGSGGAGTITGVTAGTGITGGGNSGNVSVSFDPTYGDNRYLQLTGGTMSGALVLSGNPTTNLQAATKQYVDNAVGAAGGGTITGVTAGTGLAGGGTVGTVSVGLDAEHQDGSAYDTRFVQKVGDSMTGDLYAPSFTGKEFKFDNGAGNVIQTQAYQTFGQKGALEFANTGGQKLRIMNGDGSLLFSSNASSYPTNYINFVRGDGLTFRALSPTYGMSASDAVGPLGSAPGGPTHSSVSIAEYGGPNVHIGVDALASTQFAQAGVFASNWNGSVRKAILGNGTNAAEFTGNVCINGDCKSAWPGAAAVTSITAGNGLLGGTITSNGTIDFDTTFGDTRYVNANGDSMSDSLTITATSTPIGLFVNAQTTGINAIGGTTAGYFQNGTNSSYRGWIGYNGYGGYFGAPAGGTALYAAGISQLIGNTTISGNLSMIGTGDISAPSNALQSCAWTGYIADGTAIQCPAGNPIMSGMQRSGTTMRAYCCQI